MLPDRAVMDLIASIYGASTEPERWQGVLAQAAEYLGYNSGLALWGNYVTMDPYFGVWHNFDAKFVREYVAHYSAMNPFVEHARRPAPGTAYSTWDMVSFDEWLKFDYTHECLIPYKLESCLGVDLFKTPGVMGGVEFQRRLRQGPADQKDFEA